MIESGCDSLFRDSALIGTFSFVWPPTWDASASPTFTLPRRRRSEDPSLCSGPMRSGPSSACHTSPCSASTRSLPSRWLRAPPRLKGDADPLKGFQRPSWASTGLVKGDTLFGVFFSLLLRLCFFFFSLCSSSASSGSRGRKGRKGHKVWLHQTFRYLKCQSRNNLSSAADAVPSRFASTNLQFRSLKAKHFVRAVLTLKLLE